MFSGEERGVGRDESVECSWFAALTEVRVSIAKRFGIAAGGAQGQSHRSGEGSRQRQADADVQASILHLLDCRVPM